jgi:hypothetical protein
MEAAVRTVYELVTTKPLEQLHLEGVRGLEGLKLCTLEVDPAPAGALGAVAKEAGLSAPVKLHVGVVNGLGEAKKVVKAVQDGSLEVDFVEVMACPGGALLSADLPLCAVVHFLSLQIRYVGTVAGTLHVWQCILFLECLSNKDVETRRMVALCAERVGRVLRTYKNDNIGDLYI